MSASASAATKERPDGSGVDAQLTQLNSRAQAWWDLPPAAKLAHLRTMRQRCQAHLAEFAANSGKLRTPSSASSASAVSSASAASAASSASAASDGSATTATTTGPAMLSAQTVGLAGLAAQLAAYVGAFEAFVAATGGEGGEGDLRTAEAPCPGELKTLRTTADGRKVVNVWPLGGVQAVAAGKAWVETYLEAGSAVQELDPAKYSSPGVTLVFTPGNFEGLWEVLHVLFTMNRCAAVKAHPVNGDATIHLLRTIGADLIRDGFVTTLDASLETARAALAHPVPLDLTITGSHHTYDAIVWGPGDEGTANKKAGTKKFEKPVTAELGGCGPVLIVPGEWTDAELTHCAAALASAKCANAGHVCVSPQVVVTAKGWKQRGAFLAALKAALAAALPPPTYYPGSEDRLKATMADQEKAGLTVETVTTQTAPGTKTLAPAEAKEIAFFPDVPHDAELLSKEIFGLGIVETQLDLGGDDSAVEAKDFLPAAVRFTNEKIWGNLSANIWIDPRTEAANADVFQDALDNLEAGVIAVNEWAGNIGISPAPWGAHAGSNTEDDIRSGQGFINNPYRLHRPQKSVYHSPFINPNRILGATPQNMENNILVLSRAWQFISEPGYGKLFGVVSAKVLGW